jgi:hypothetical protein
VNLGSMYARSVGDDLVVCAVIPTPWFPSSARVEAQYQVFLDNVARQALDRARTDLPYDFAASLSAYRARSAPSGLLEVARQHTRRAVRHQPRGAATRAPSHRPPPGRSSQRGAHRSTCIPPNPPRYYTVPSPTTRRGGNSQRRLARPHDRR